MPKIATVSVFRDLEAELSYSVPSEFEAFVERGSLVRVPLRFGTATGIVIDCQKRSDFFKNEKNGDQKKESEGSLFGDSEKTFSEFKFKPIYSLVQKEPALSPELIDLAFWMRDYYGCKIQSVFESMIPSAVRDGVKALSVSEIRIEQKLSEDELCKMGKKAPKQAELYKFVAAYNSPIIKSALLKLSGAQAQTLASLVKKGIFAEEKKRLNRSAFDDELSQAEMVKHDDLTLNEEQARAFEEIRNDILSEKFKTRLLYGVTGSGKTEIYIRAMKEVIARGGDCVFLVPEISLTPQTVGRLRSRLGDCGLVVWHSNLSDGQRLDAWRTLASGKAKVVVGARSCVFAPLKNLKLVIVDEEHDSAYKQDKSPRYNGRDIAVLRAKLRQCTCVLGSATPSLESLYNAKSGKYLISKINSRVDSRKMPTVYIVDMKRQKRSDIISQLLNSKIADRLDKGEQIMLFLNRRGYSKLFECPDCGHVETCPRCSISLTWHKKFDEVKCHLCGYLARAPWRCPKCSSEKARWKSPGTQKLEEIISKIYPSARIGRMDADTMRHRNDYRRILGEFRAGKLDVLVGTQMITKGLDFPRVTLVGIINADISLNMPDFRAAEKTYQLIVQVAGRAGRGEREGEVVVQTMYPEAAPIQYAKSDDMEDFLEEELSARKEYGYPPTSHIIRHIFRSRNEESLEIFLKSWAQKADEKLSSICQIRGPSPAPIEKSEDFYRWHIWYFCTSVKPAIAKILELKKELPTPNGIIDAIDVDPISLM